MTSTADFDYFTTIERVIIDSQYVSEPALIDPTTGQVSFTLNDSPENYTGVVLWHGSDYSVPYLLDTTALVEGDRFVFETDDLPFLGETLYYVSGGAIYDKGGNLITGYTGSYNCLNANKYPIVLIPSNISTGDTRTFTINNNNVNVQSGTPSYEWG